MFVLASACLKRWRLIAQPKARGESMRLEIILSAISCHAVLSVAVSVGQSWLQQTELCTAVIRHTLSSPSFSYALTGTPGRRRCCWTKPQDHPTASHADTPGYVYPFGPSRAMCWYVKEEKELLCVGRNRNSIRLLMHVSKLWWYTSLMWLVGGS